MAIKNRTSVVPATKSTLHIEQKLVENGATQVLKEYDSFGKVSAFSFTIQPHTGGGDSATLNFRLPVNVDACEKVLLANGPGVRTPSALKKLPAQAERTAWKILSDWVDVQMALIELKQASVTQVFFPYIISDHSGKTLFDVAKESGFKKMLPSGN